MKSRTPSIPRAALALFVSVLLAVGLAPIAGAQDATPGAGLRADGLATPESAGGFRAASSRLVTSDETLLDLTGDEPTAIVVKLDYDATASYAGDVQGFEATSPQVTGRPLSADDADVRAYEDTYAEGLEADFVDALQATVPDAQVGESLRTVYGGVAVVAPAGQIKDIARLDGVVAVQRDRLEEPLTDSSREFIGATDIYPELGGSDLAGAGVIVGVLDSGSWPEHPAYEENVDLPAPPPRADTTARTCDFGDNPLTAAVDPFVCNDKLIGGEPFLATYNAVVGGEVYPDSARDSDGHGTHTSTTAAGANYASAPLLGVDRGPAGGVAPGAHVIAYKVCGLLGCFSSDSAAAVAEAILDGVDVINFSISGGTSPFSDPVELAFLDAYAAGVFVAASAGNSGPGAGTTNHLSPWVTTVAASTQNRAFVATATLDDGTSTLAVDGVSVTDGVSTATELVRSADVVGYADDLCLAPAPAGSLAGKVVVCTRGAIARVDKGFNVLAGGAVGMLLVNPPGTTDVETDNHWLPTVHFNPAEHVAIDAFLDAATGPVTVTTTPGTAVSDPAFGNIMATFSSRGPGGDWLKPDVTAPGVQILAGHTPTPDTSAAGPPGELFQAIAGTSMSSPHTAGAAALIKAAHPDWTPGQIKSALMTTARTNVLDDNGVDPADPFDFGAGHIDLSSSGPANVGLAFDETFDNFLASAASPLNRLNLNLPSINAPVAPGVINAYRTATNVTDDPQSYSVVTDAPAGASIDVFPSSFTVAPGDSVDLRIRIENRLLSPGQYFGDVMLQGGPIDQHLPVAFNVTSPELLVESACTPTSVIAGEPSSESACTVSVQNDSQVEATVRARSTVSPRLEVTSASGGAFMVPGRTDRVAYPNTVLQPRMPASPEVDFGASPFGYIPLDAFAIAFTPIGDEESLTFTVDPFEFADQVYSTISVTSNGYAVAGGTSTTEFVPQTFPDPTPPNSVLAPFWTDLDGTETGSEGVAAGVLTDSSGDSWIVFEWRLQLWGASGPTVDDQVRVFQTWIGINGVEDISFTYDPGNLPGAPPAGYGLTVGAENADGSSGDQLGVLPTSDVVVSSTPGLPGDTLTYGFTAIGGPTPGAGSVTTRVEAEAIFNGAVLDTVNLPVLPPSPLAVTDVGDGGGETPPAGGGGTGGGASAPPTATPLTPVGEEPGAPAQPGPAEQPDQAGAESSAARLERLAGDSRIATAVAISRQRFADGAATAFVATAGTFPDALSGSAVATRLGAPVLLTAADQLPEATAAELRRLGVSRIVVLGGEQAVSAAVADALAGIARVERLAGADRHATSAAISAASFAAGVDVAYVATGDAYADALSGAVAAANAGGPVLLVSRDRLPASIAAELRRLQPGRIVVLGGEAAVSQGVYSELARLSQGTIERVAGSSRYATSAAIAQATFSVADVVYVATGDGFADALAGGPATSGTAPLLLVGRDSVPAEVADLLAAWQPDRVVVLGGTAAVSDATAQSLMGHASP